MLQSILLWGFVWGAFEATAGVVLHQLPVALGAYIWFPAAYFFMDRVYQKTGRKRAVVWTALLSASLKLLNLFSPIRPDYVINPAVSIILESLAMVLALKLNLKLRILSVNTLWRLGYAFYVSVLASAWIREVSVVQSAAAYFTFFVKENLLSSLVCGIVIALYSVTRYLGHKPVHGG